jgi:membrane protease YdiL (CAAX protease family)
MRASVRRAGSLSPLVFLGTFLAAWLVLDRLAPSPPLPVTALVPLVLAGAVLVGAEVWLGGLDLREVPDRLGLGRAPARVLVAATLVGCAVIATMIAGTWALDLDVELRGNWPAVVVGALLFHGVAEELVWRGFAFGHFRQTSSFRGAVKRSIPLIALTHVPIVVTNGLAVGLLAVLSAAVTCLPFSYLRERGHSIWGAAILHGCIDMWQVVARPVPVTFSVVILLASILVPLTTFAFGDRLFGPQPEQARPLPSAVH